MIVIRQFPNARRVAERMSSVGTADRTRWNLNKQFTSETDRMPHGADMSRSRRV